MQILPVSFSRYPKDHFFPLLTMQNTRNEDSEIETDAKNKGNKDDVFAWRERFVYLFYLTTLRPEDGEVAGWRRQSTCVSRPESKGKWSNLILEVPLV